MADINNENASAFDKKKQKTLKILKNICDEQTYVVFQEELSNLFDIFGELPFKMVSYDNDNRYINFVRNQKIVGTLAISGDFIECYFNINNQNVRYSIKKQLDLDGKVQYIKHIYVEGIDFGKYSSIREERELPESIKMYFEVDEVLDHKNRVVEQNFILKESSLDINSIENEQLSVALKELYFTTYESQTHYNGDVSVYAECPRGCASAKKVTDWAKLPKAKIEFKEDYLPYSILCNLEFMSKRMLCCDEFKGFKIHPFIEDCDDKYIFMASVNDDYYGKTDHEIGEELE